MLRYYYDIRYKNSLVLVLALLFFCPEVIAQTSFNGILINNVDSSIVPYAAIHLKETDMSVLTGDKGAFNFSLPDGLKRLTLTITAIGCKKTIEYKRTFSDTEKIYIELIPGSLKEFTVVGMSPREIVEKAIDAISDNYMADDYYSFSLFRQYQRVNNVFTNLAEGQLVVKFKLSGSKNKIIGREAYAVTDLRRSAYIPSPDNLYESSLPMLMEENPIYHLAESSLTPGNFSSYTFSFDTADNVNDYVIDYVCKDFSTESHGVVNYSSYNFKGESWETGRLVIDKTSYAIKKIQRKSFRYPEYLYPKLNNLVQPERIYYVEFIKGEMVADYVPFQGKWYLKQIVHQYTNEFFRGGSRKHEYVVTDCFEWYADAISQELPDFNQKFYPGMENGRYYYDGSHWTKNTHPFYFFDNDLIYRDLGRNGPLDDQYYSEGKRR